MPEKYTLWDVTEFLDTEKRVCLYLEAAAEEDEGDGELIRRAWSDIERAHNSGKNSINIAMNRNELCKALQNHGIYDNAIPKIVSALEMSVPIAE